MGTLHCRILDAGDAKSLAELSAKQFGSPCAQRSNRCWRRNACWSLIGMPGLREQLEIRFAQRLAREKESV